MSDKTRRYRNLVTLAATVLLTALCFVSVMISEKPVEEPDAETTAILVSARSDIEEFILEREQLRAAEIQSLKEISANENAQSEVRLAAQRRIMDIYARAEQEMNIEGVLRARGFDEALATVSEDCANILVRTEALSQADADIILELVCRETGLIGGNIKIIPLN
ncbi:MAG: SpoIIIAH-like family protein [Clostridiales bacterium]|nr:SpoIIIAH-like family protein [Clostridiales bacterium]